MERGKTQMWEYLYKLDDWCEGWLLKFQTKKCKYMTTGKNRSDSGYKLQDQVLRTAKEKDIGLTIDDLLSFQSHISENANKASSTFGLLRRCFQFLDKKISISLYKTLVRIHLDYEISIWSPYKA